MCVAYGGRFMRSRFCMPTEIIFGQGAEEKTAEVVKNMKKRTAGARRLWRGQRQRATLARVRTGLLAADILLR